MIQGEVLMRVRGKVFAQKRDQRELIKVAQRNFRKYLQMRDWGWFVIIQKTRGMIGQPNPEEELRLLEEAANASYGEYKAALDKTAELEGNMGALKDEIGAMTKQLSEEQGSISVYTDRQTKALSIKATTEAELAGQVEVLKAEENSRISLAADVKSHSGSIGAVKKDIEDVELVITKLNKEKKHLSSTQAKSAEDLVSAEEKVHHLNQVKSQLESALDQLEGGLDKEKKGRAGTEKQKRKIEGDLKMAQDTVADLERERRDIENTIANKEKNVHMLSAKLDDEQSL